MCKCFKILIAFLVLLLGVYGYLVVSSWLAGNAPDATVNMQQVTGNTQQATVNTQQAPAYTQQPADNPSMEAGLTAETSQNPEFEARFRAAVETQYPEFKDFENQKSFAGQKVKILKDGFDRYYAYEVLGSGLPIIQATCFRVDRMGQVFKVGTFPDPLDSFLGYPDLDPRNCRGIK